MAVLGSSTLTDCEYIEDFLGGIDPGIPGGTTGFKCVFNQTTPSVSWTKETDSAYNDIALRVVTGGSGAQISGSTAFSSVLTTKSIGLSIQSTPSNASLSAASGNVSVGQRTIQNQTTASSIPLLGALADLAPHNHDYTIESAVPVFNAAPERVIANLHGPFNSGARGGDGQHGHTVTFNLHSHPISSTHGHSFNDNGHSHPISGPLIPLTQENFTVLYRDVVIARKDVKP